MLRNYAFRRRGSCKSPIRCVRDRDAAFLLRNRQGVSSCRFLAGMQRRIDLAGRRPVGPFPKETRLTRVGARDGRSSLSRTVSIRSKTRSRSFIKPLRVRTTDPGYAASRTCCSAACGGSRSTASAGAAVLVVSPQRCLANRRNGPMQVRRATDVAAPI